MVLLPRLHVPLVPGEGETILGAFCLPDEPFNHVPLLLGDLREGKMSISSALHTM